MSVLWCSDLHLKPAHAVRKRPLADDSFDALDQIENIAIMRGVVAVILGGDVYDSSNPSGEAVFRVSSFVNNLKELGITTYFIEGNHDRVNKNPFLSDKHYEEHRLLCSVGAVPLGTREIDGLTYHGIDYCPVQQLHERLNDVPECDVLCLHAGFQHLLGFAGAFDIRMDDVPPEIRKLVLVGHVHVHDERKTPRGVVVASSGSTWPWRLTEVGKPHGAFIVNPDATLEYQELNSRKYYEIDELADIEDTSKEDHHLKPVLFYDPQALPDLDRSKYPRVELIPMGTKEAEQVEEIKENVATSLQEAVEIGVPAKDYPEEHAFLLDLLNADDPTAFVEESMRERKVTFKEVS